jgi:hypothetical protein
MNCSRELNVRGNCHKSHRADAGRYPIDARPADAERLGDSNAPDV